MTWCAQRDWEWGLDEFYYLSNHGTQSNSYIHVNEKHCNAMGEYDMLGLPPGDNKLVSRLKVRLDLVLYAFICFSPS